MFFLVATEVTRESKERMHSRTHTNRLPSPRGAGVTNPSNDGENKMEKVLLGLSSALFLWGKIPYLTHNSKDRQACFRGH